MNRRLFLAALAGAVLDPERLLWRPGRKLISIPKPQPIDLFPPGYEEALRYRLALELAPVFVAGMTAATRNYNLFLEMIASSLGQPRRSDLMAARQLLGIEPFPPVQRRAARRRFEPAAPALLRQS